ncbi:MAG: CoB--CoM heterodisulfide reductase iron-sulfur subunit A family protein [Actinobacteria bacterium]|nr:CoB--CoM heterodisulfide reductase iron-sulfur subunit A family protein [Actinomycetota bacterium]
MNVAVYLCQENPDAGGGVNLDSVAKYAANLTEVTQVRSLGVRPKLLPESLAVEIGQQSFDRLVIAGDTPGYFKPAFTRAMLLAGRDPGEVRLASFRQHGAISLDETERAKAIVACAVSGVPFWLAAVPKFTTVHADTLVIGGGVAGMQAALEIADAGKHVYLVERTGTIGGHMAMFDKTFPTLDCAACILTPKMVAVAQHEMIDLLTLSEVEAVAGVPGDYRVTIRRQPRRVDQDACVTCGDCAAACPVTVPSEFDCGIASRTSIYMPFPQAVPNTYLVDEASCRYVLSEGTKCGVCARKCPKECIDLDEVVERAEVEVGSIVLATGYDVYDAALIERYGYGVYPNVLTALEFERLTNASGPTGGRIVTQTLQHDKRAKADVWVFDPAGEAPRSVAIVHCVGSRDHNHNSYCSRVCCMYSLKFAHLVKEKLPDAECYEFYIDMRAFGKGYEEFAERIKQEGTFVVRGRSAKVTGADGRLLVRGEDILSETLLEFPVDMVLLAVGLVPAHGSDLLATLLGVDSDSDGWFSELDYNGDPTDTERGGVFVAGACQGPKDIPDTVAQASAAAAGVLKSIASGRGYGSLSGLVLSDIEARARELAGKGV